MALWTLYKLWKEGSLGGQKTAPNRHIYGKAQMSLHNISKDKFNKMKTRRHSIERIKYLIFFFRELFTVYVYGTHMYTVQLENVEYFVCLGSW